MSTFPLRAVRPALRLALALAAGEAAASLRAADWPQFRGPHSNGFTTETDVSWQLDAPDQLVWTADLPGRGVSGPIIVGNRVFVTAADGPRQEVLLVLCLDAGDGSLLWERRFWATGRTMCHEKTSVACGTPASDGQHVFALFSSNDLFCLDLDGNLRWLRGIAHDYPNVSNSLGMSSSLVVADGTVVAQVENDAESYTLGLDVRTGTNRWRLDRPPLSNWTSPVLIQPTPDRRLVGLQSGKGLTAIEPATGRVVWNYGEGASTIASSAPAGPEVYIPSSGLTAVRGETAAAPKQLWRAGPLRPGTASPVVGEGRLYVLNDAGVLNCGDLTEGRRLWQLRLKGPFSASPVATKTHLYAVNEKGLVQVVDLSAPEGAVASERDLGRTVLATPAISRQALYVRGEGRLWKLGRSSR